MDSDDSISDRREPIAYCKSSSARENDKRPISKGLKPDENTQFVGLTADAEVSSQATGQQPSESLARAIESYIIVWGGDKCSHCKQQVWGSESIESERDTWRMESWSQSRETTEIAMENTDSAHEWKWTLRN